MAPTLPVRMIQSSNLSQCFNKTLSSHRKPQPVLQQDTLVSLSCTVLGIALLVENIQCYYEIQQTNKQTNNI